MPKTVTPNISQVCSSVGFLASVNIPMNHWLKNKLSLDLNTTFGNAPCLHSMSIKHLDLACISVRDMPPTDAHSSLMYGKRWIHWLEKHYRAHGCYGVLVYVEIGMTWMTAHLSASNTRTLQSSARWSNFKSGRGISFLMIHTWHICFFRYCSVKE